MPLGRFHLDRHHADFHLQTQKLKPPEPVSIMIHGSLRTSRYETKTQAYKTIYLLSKISYLQFDPVFVERTRCTKSRVR